MKIWFKNQWIKMKKWWIALLVALGIITAPILYAEIVNFTYTPATQYTTGEPMPLSDIAVTILYCDGNEIVRETGADGNFDPELGLGSHDCYATHVSIHGSESAPSNIVTKVVTPGPPLPPVLDP